MDGMHPVKQITHVMLTISIADTAGRAHMVVKEPPCHSAAEFSKQIFSAKVFSLFEIRKDLNMLTIQGKISVGD